jgi:hypothetical protein
VRPDTKEVNARVVTPDVQTIFDLSCSKSAYLGGLTTFAQSEHPLAFRLMASFGLRAPGLHAQQQRD